MEHPFINVDRGDTMFILEGYADRMSADLDSPVQGICDVLEFTIYYDEMSED